MTAPRKINLLPDEVASKIAAGEVVERPASVVRELLDNAIDSGALNIRVEIRGGRLLRPAQELLAIDDLQNAVGAGAVGEIDAMAERDRSVHARGYRSRGRAGFLTGQAEVADEDGLRGIAQVVDLRHA